LAQQRKAELGLWVTWKMFLVVPRPDFARWVLLSKSEDGVRLGDSLRETSIAYTQPFFVHVFTSKNVPPIVFRSPVFLESEAPLVEERHMYRGTSLKRTPPSP